MLADLEIHAFYINKARRLKKMILVVKFCTEFLNLRKSGVKERDILCIEKLELESDDGTVKYRIVQDYDPYAWDVSERV